ncbi:Nuclear pore complex protein Nup160, partial [Stegodyphus mimosarum]
MSSLNYLLNRLDLGTEANDAADASYTKYPYFANSSSGIGALCAGLSHFAKQRFEFCRDLLLLEVVVWGLDTMENEQLENLMMQSTIIPRTVSLVRSYYIILWCTERECVAVPSSVQDAAFKQFCVLELPEFTSSDLSYIKPGSTISHLFFQDGGCKARKIMDMRYLSLDSEDDWSSLFPSLIISAATLLWPLEGNLLFPEFLFARCQYLPLQEYDRQLQGWCVWNKQFLNFLVASSYLILGQPQKALRNFLEVSKHIEAESYLCSKLIKGRYSTGSSIISLFCMRVIQMFEQFSLSACVVQLASTAIDQIKETDPHVPIFYSVLFKHHLNLGHSTEAFSTLIKNPDSSRRKDCLRQLIVKLCEEKQFQKIIEFNYLAYEEEVIAILESRARCSDLCHNTSFYGILYALHVHHKKYRKAAAAMYELAMRFGREVTSFKGLRKQVSCYLAAINCLHLAEPEYAWIVKPSLHASENLEDLDVIYKNSPKRNSEGDEILSSLRPVKVEVLGLPDILREYNLAKARLLYVQKYHRTSNLVIAPLTPEETVALLLNGCLFEPAIQLSDCFSLSLIPVFEAITYRCLSSCLRSDVQSFDDADQYSKQSDLSIDLTNNNQMFNVWHILEKYLLQYEKNGKSELHRCVTEKLLAHGAALPAWLKLSYQKCNFTELLNLYITHGHFEDSLNLVINYIKAVLGARKEDFNLKFTLVSNSPPVWLPHTYIDILLYAATDFKDGHFQDLYEDLTKTLDLYNKAVESV